MRDDLGMNLSFNFLVRLKVRYFLYFTWAIIAHLSAVETQMPPPAASQVGHQRLHLRAGVDGAHGGRGQRGQQGLQAGGEGRGGAGGGVGGPGGDERGEELAWVEEQLVGGGGGC